MNSDVKLYRSRCEPARPRFERLIIRVNDTELSWVQHAAKLRHMSLAEYVRQAINASLRKEGVDAVLLRERR
jgi:predicted HicB family RNase H-like nuclease